MKRRAVLRTLTGSLLALPLGAARKPVRAADELPWWKRAIAYEIYPRSFQDSNGDGIGDFPGMTERLPYLAELGVDAVWVAACFDSPNADNGYDVRDYRTIMPDFGTMADFDAFLAGATQLGIRVILDMVFNHTSDQHPWFVASRRSRSDPHRDFYIWRDGVDGKPPTNWPSAFGGSAWAYDAPSGQWYLHTFAAQQPDLNWDNPAVRHELYDILRFWAARGVSGFRFDAIMHISKPAIMRDLTPAELAHPGPTGGPKLDAYLQEMHRDVFAGTSLYGVAEGWGASRAEIIALTDDRRAEMSSAFRMDFQLLDLDDWKKLPWHLAALRAFNADNAFDDDPHVWPVVFLEDHDFPRIVSRFGSTNPAYRRRVATSFATMLLSLRGTPYLYQGQEIGMANFPFERIDQFDDIAVRNGWRDLVQTGIVPADVYLRNVAQTGRDNARTPMQWDATPNAGFTTAATPWLAVNPDHTTFNVASESRDPASVLAYYRAMIALRKRTPALVTGAYRDISGDHATVYAYVRGTGDEALCVLLNLADTSADFTLPPGLRAGRLAIGNLGAPRATGRTIALAPWQSAIVALRSIETEHAAGLRDDRGQRARVERFDDAGVAH
jgi:oligo-1,6-glucosidase